MTSTLLHFDPGAGASGDMVLGALIHLGVPPDVVDKAVRAVGVPARLKVEDQTRHGVVGKKVSFVDEHGVPVDLMEQDPSHIPPLVVEHHPHHHDHPHHPPEAHHHHHHHPWPEVEKRVAHSSLPTPVRDLALAILRRLAVAESQVHGIPLERVALHEVAAADSLGDMVGSAAALCHLQPDRITCDAFGICSSSVRMAHGTLPTPGPATGLLLCGAPVIGLDGRMETVTPTGAAILTTVAHAFGPPPAMTLRAQGFGLGRKDPPERANLLRAWLGETGRRPEKIPPEDVRVVETNVDDATPQMVAQAAQMCLKAGALDAWVSSIVMKKGRPGWTVHALVETARQADVVRVLLTETTASGVRVSGASRTVAQRETVPVRTSVGVIRVKVARMHGETLHAVPEHDDCVKLAEQTGMPVPGLHALALASYHAQGESKDTAQDRRARSKRSARSSP